MPEFRINRVYTRTGDKGETGLVGGERVLKCDYRVEVYGDVDELNSMLGSVVTELSFSDKADLSQNLKTILVELQQELFDLGSELATKTPYQNMWVTEERHIKRLETLCDHFGDNLPELRSFIIPGGNRAASALHLARCICRRAERALVKLTLTESDLSPYPLEYLNRLSDLLFNLSRYVIKIENIEQPLWVPEKSRLGLTNS